jgi:nucleoid-associated protein YgaU
MTRETKIGLLVGLAFIIVIGILLSDHLTSTLQPPQAPLTVAAEHVRNGVASPGVGQVAPERAVQVPQANPNPLVIQNEPPRGEQGRAEITVLPPASGRTNDLVIPPTTYGQGNEQVVIQPPVQAHQEQGIIRSETPELPTGLDRIRQANPEEFVVVPAEGVREYTAEPGDTISKIARRELGADTAANRTAIMKLNPGLRNDPKLLRAGETYMIPAAGVSPPTVIPVGTPIRVGAAPTTRPASHENVYTTKAGDTLWRIAVTQVGTHEAVGQIMELNRDVLKGSNRIRPGMKLRLPVRPGVAAGSSQASSM